jgi:hypothetical protein
MKCHTKGRLFHLGVLSALGMDGWELVAIMAINHKTAGTDHIGIVSERRKS